MSTRGSANDDAVEEEDYLQYVAVAEEAARVAGDLIVNYKDNAQVTSTKWNTKDLLTEVDPMCERKIKELILSNFPDHQLLGEEEVPPGKEESAKALQSILANPKSKYLWIIDPIDGTTNFVHGIPMSMPSIALAKDGKLIAAAIYDPHRGEMFTASLGNGSYLNGERVYVESESVGGGQVGGAVVAMGSPPAQESLEMSLKAIQALMPKVRTIRMFGSAALMLAWVACGRLSAYWEYDLSSWDTAAGALLITEAGGKMTDLSNQDYAITTRKIIGSHGNANVHEGLLEILNSVGVQ